MITVMVYSVMFETEYEFRIDDDTDISEIVEEIGEMICQREQCELSGDPSRFMLFSKQKKIVLDSKATLRDYGIKNGDSLFFA